MLASLKQRYERGLEFLAKTDIARWIFDTVRSQATQGDVYVLKLMALIFFGSILAGISNSVFFHYELEVFNAAHVGLIMGPTLFYITGLMMEKRHPRGGSIVLSIGFASLYWASMAVGCASLLATPLNQNLIDPTLLQWDQWLGFNQVAWLHFVNSFPWLMRVFSLAYNSWSFQVVIVALLLGCFGNKRITRLWMLSALISFLIGGFLYYCLPSLPPAAHLISGYFKISSYQLIDRFYNIHQYLPYVVRGSDGLIAFPSFHVNQAMLNGLCLWWCFKTATKNRPLLLVLSICLSILNITLILSTLSLGFHFLVDVIAGALLAVFSLWAASQFYQGEKCP